MHYYRLPYLKNSDAYFQALAPLGKRIWLDSGKPHAHHGRYDILSAAPQKVLGNPSIAAIESCVEQLETASATLREQHPELPFHGGAMGYFNYEYNASDFGIPPREDLCPSLVGIFDWALIQDHHEEIAHLFFLDNCDNDFPEKVKQLLSNRSNAPSLPFSVSDLSNDVTQESYVASVDRIHEHILAGDSYQVNFSQRFSGNFEGSADTTYLKLREVMPSPFSAYCELGDDCVLSLSPERFIQLQNRTALTQPIKGTTARGATKEEDDTLAKCLLNSEKNRAENVMIVDLLRNDFSQSCEPFSVKVPKLFALESFANVHHLVSTVEGKVAEGVSPLTFFMRCFPGGSITGAPKKRAMEIIANLEKFARNIYCGSIFYLSTSGKLDSNIAIRTLLIHDEKIYCWGGGGIVADSVAEDEYDESLQKIAVLLETLTK